MKLFLLQLMSKISFISFLLKGEGRESTSSHLHERPGDCSPASGLQTELLLHVRLLLLLGGRIRPVLRQPADGIWDAGQTSAAEGLRRIQHLLVCLRPDWLWEVVHVSGGHIGECVLSCVLTGN